MESESRVVLNGQVVGRVAATTVVGEICGTDGAVDFRGLEAALGQLDEEEQLVDDGHRTSDQVALNLAAHSVKDWLNGEAVGVS